MLTVSEHYESLLWAQALFCFTLLSNLLLKKVNTAIIPDFTYEETEAQGGPLTCP